MNFPIWEVGKYSGKSEKAEIGLLANNCQFHPSTLLPLLDLVDLHVPQNAFLAQEELLTAPSTDDQERLRVHGVPTIAAVSPLANRLGFVSLPPMYRLFLAIMRLGYAMLTQVVKTCLLAGVANDGGGGENAFIKQEITIRYFWKVTL
jgi:hypothetical protein